MQKKSGIIDSDKVLIAFALWAACVVVFATALTLPMLPDMVTIFYRPTEIETDLPDAYSKFNNLWLILLSLIPVLIVSSTAYLKRRNRMQNNFISIMMFSIMLSVLMSSVIVYGITEQFDSSSSVKAFNFSALYSIVILFVLSMLSAFIPSAIHSKPMIDKCNNGTGYKWSIVHAMSKFWYVGTFGFLIGAVACSFIPGMYAYIVPTVCVVAYAVFVLVMGNKITRNNALDKTE